MSEKSSSQLIYRFENRESLRAAIKSMALPFSCRWWDPVRLAWSGIELIDSSGVEISKGAPLYLLDIAGHRFALKHASNFSRALPFNPWNRLYFKGNGCAVLSADGGGVVFHGEPNLASTGCDVLIPFSEIQYKFGKTIKVSGMIAEHSSAASIEFTFASAEDDELLFNLMLQPAGLPEAFERISYESGVLDAYWEKHGRKSAAAVPLVSLSLILFAVLLFQGAGVWGPGDEMSPYLRWAANSTAATPFGEWWRLLVSQFTHYGVVHLAMNMFALYSIGIEVEPVIGRTAVYASYLLTGLAASIGSLIIYQQPVWSCGASGSIFGLIGVMMGCLVMRSSSMPGGYAWSSLKKYILYVVLNFAYAARFDQIDHAAHFFGLAFGFALGVVCSVRSARSIQVTASSYNWPAVSLIALVLPFAALMVAPNRLSIKDALFYDGVALNSVGRYVRGMQKLFSLLERDALLDAKKFLKGETTSAHAEIQRALEDWEPQGVGAKEWRAAFLTSLAIRAEQFKVLDELLGKNYSGSSASEEADLARFSAISKRAQESEDKIPEFYPSDEKRGSRSGGKK